MANICAYKDKLWKEFLSFSYTGATSQFQLEKGTYLLICNGAFGGHHTSMSSNGIGGGTSYGVLTLKDTTTLFANVGGNGGCPSDNITPGVGGFNGGGNGGHSYNNSYATGAGGGGASDIRINENSLFARVIVAGGAGGMRNHSDGTYFNCCNSGGGIVGGFVEAKDSTEPNYHLYATQTSGYSFGIGQTAADKTSSTYSYGRIGASGAGGGWYGGYASNSSADYSSTNGGGGSGYVLTSSSYKPTGYLLGEDYYLTDTSMTNGTSLLSSIIIYKPLDILNKGDIITVPMIGTTLVQLQQGKYRLKCYGGHGCCNTRQSTYAKGGYAEGVINLKDSLNDLYVNVGGCGFGSNQLNVDYTQLINPTRSFNGGGSPSSFGNVARGTAGGGATDIRINNNSLFSRVIVAGGSGGTGYTDDTRLGGTGGGTTGGISVVNAEYSPGPGTQTSSPQTTNIWLGMVNGGFGYGGNGYNIGGAGGGGWYGGSGYHTNSGYGGHGGSGYVLTASSYKPGEYQLGEDYYLTETTLTNGGNNTILTVSKAVIEVIDINIVKMLCHDNQGYKRYDDELKSWVYLSEQITVEMFETYGSYSVTDDTGLLDNYEILIHDTSDIIAGMSLLVSPPKQTISTTIDSNMNVSNIKVDKVCDDSVYDIKVRTNRHGVGDNAKIDVNIDIDKLNHDSDNKLKLYCVQMFSK